MLYIANRYQRVSSHKSKLVTVAIALFDKIRNGVSQFFLSCLLCSFQSFPKSRFQALVDRKGQWMQVMTYHGCHVVVIVGAEYISVESGYRRVFCSFSRSRKFDIMYKPFHTFRNFLNRFFFYMAFHHIVRLLLTAVIRRFDAQTEKFRVLRFKINNSCFLWGNIQSQPLF